jgi:hypothetical protein
MTRAKKRRYNGRNIGGTEAQTEANSRKNSHERLTQTIDVTRNDDVPEIVMSQSPRRKEVKGN